MKCKTLKDLLLAQECNQACINTWVATDQTETLKYCELVGNARRRLTDLRANGLRKGDYLILYLYDEMAFIECFWACMLGGIVPVPVAPGNTQEHKNKLMLVARDLGAPFIMSEDAAVRRFEEHTKADAKLLERLFYFETLDTNVDIATPVDVLPDDMAYIQFSSGSTRQPKGVKITHRNLIANIDDLCHSFGLLNDAKTLSWMPLTHDMGLIGFHLCPLSVGIEQHIMRTALFVRRPLSWLQIASETGATTLGSPNFGYRHWLQAQEKSGGELPDLSNVRQIINGAEQISLCLVKEFMDTLAPAGLDQGAMCPSYGLAEACLGISVSPPGPGARAVWVDRAKMQMGESVPVLSAPDPNGMGFAIEGPVFQHSEVRIANSQGQDLGECVLGEIQIRGANVTTGYLNQPEANGELFTPDGWLRTSDLGFLYHGELVVTGRMTDMIVVNGQNLFAHDVELMIEQAGLAKTGEVAAGILERHGQEAFALFLRERSPNKSFLDRARTAKNLIYRTCGLRLAEVVPVRSIPKTTSGKVQRSALSQSMEAGEYDAVLAEIYETQPEPEKASA